MPQEPKNPPEGSLSATFDLRDLGRVRLMHATKDDIPAILTIRKRCSHFEWDFKDIAALMAADNHSVLVAKGPEETLGVLITAREGPVGTIIALDIYPGARRRRLGLSILDHIKKEAIEDVRFKGLTTDVGAGNLSAQLFLRAMEFRCLASYSEEDGDEWFEFYWDVDVKDPVIQYLEE